MAKKNVAGTRENPAGLEETSEARHYRNGEGTATPKARKEPRQVAWDKRNPLARWAHRAFESALRRGLVERKPCEVCGDAKTEFHHDPAHYDQPLNGRHLCRLHHRQEHARLHAEQRRRARAGDA